MNPEDGERVVDLSDEAPLLPGATRDDTDEGWGERSRVRRDEHDEWLLDQRPPHWE